MAKVTWLIPVRGSYYAREAHVGWGAFCSVCHWSIDKGGVYVWNENGVFEAMHSRCAKKVHIDFIPMPRLPWYQRLGCMFIRVVVDGDDYYEIIKNSRKPLLCGVFRNGWEFLDVTVNRGSAHRLVSEEVVGRRKNVSRNLESYGKALAKRLHSFYIEQNWLQEAAALVAQPSLLSDLFAKEHVMAKTQSTRQAATPAAARKTATAPAAPSAPAPVANPEPAAETKAPKVRLSATEEEIQAAVEGTLGPREVLGDPNQEALTSSDEKGRPAGRPLGVNTGLPILMAWCLAFQENEKLKPRDPNNPTEEESIIGSLGHQPDEQITAFMRSEFPGRNTPAFNHPQSCRNDFNSGKFTKLIRPKIQSSRYDEKGDIMAPSRRGFAKKDPAAPAPEGATAPAPAPAAAPAKRAAVAKPSPAPAPAAAPARRAVARKPAAATA